MILQPFMFDIAVKAGGQHLILPSSLIQSQVEMVIAHKAAILAALRAHQIAPSGFLTCLPRALMDELRAVPWLVLDLETSALTRYIVPDRVTKRTAIGSGTWLTYQAEHQNATIDIRPRIRVVTLHHDQLGTYAFDLDAMPPQQRQQLFDVVLRDKIVIGHNAGSDLSWLFAESEARPRFLLDTMMLVRQIRPGVLLRLFGMAAKGDETTRALAVKAIEGNEGKVPATLDYVAACLRMQVPDKSYQKPETWCVTSLSTQHHQYVAGCVTLSLKILRFLLPQIAVEDMPAAIESAYPWYPPFGVTTMRLADAHVRGVPFDCQAADKLRVQLIVELEVAADELKQLCEFAGLARESLVDPISGETRQMKQALAQHAEANGVRLPENKKFGISTNSKELILLGANKLPGWLPYSKLKSTKKAIGVIDEYKRAAALDGRMHSIIGCTTNTGRMASSNPSLQNVPRVQRFRELVHAKKDHVILSGDYSAVELRVAAALAERSIIDIRARIKAGDTSSWFMQHVSDGCNSTTRLVSPPEPEPPWTLKWLAEIIPATAQTVLRRDKQTMASVFRLGLDPHLVTAIDMLRLAGAIDVRGLSSVEWLVQHDVEDRRKLAETWKAERQKAKAVNFGLLYGMGAVGLYRYGVTNFGVQWTIEEATVARNAWFRLYPELRLWHFWTKYIPSSKFVVDAVVVWDDYARKLMRPEYQASVFQPTTLTGRPFAILNGFREARNYQDQGTAADILVRAIAMMPGDVASMWILAVHDELLFEVPTSRIEEVQRTIVETMVRAAELVIGGNIPVSVATAVGETWE